MNESEFGIFVSVAPPPMTWTVVTHLPGHPGWLTDLELVDTPTGPRARQCSVFRSNEERTWGAMTLENLDGFVIPPPPPTIEELKPQMLRAVPFQKMRSYASFKTSEFFTETRAKVVPTPKRPGRAGRPDVEYAHLAAAYVEKLQTGTRSPTKDLAEDLNYSQSQLNNMLTEARSRGLLDGTTQGRPGGHLTTKALDLLRPPMRT